jgi:ribose 5-phosphate isomerase
MMAERDRLTRAATVAEVRSGMRLGLGTGGTVGFALQELARRIRKETLWVAGIPTSRRAEAAAQGTVQSLGDGDGSGMTSHAEAGWESMDGVGAAAGRDGR